MLKIFFRFFNALLFLTAATGIAVIYCSTAAFEVPAFVVRKVLDCVPAGDFRISAGTVKFRRGVLVVRDLAVEDVKSGQQIITAGFARAKLSLKESLHGNYFPGTVFLDNAALFCPPAVSRSGEREQLISDGRILLLPSKKGCLNVGMISAKIGGSAWSIGGEIPLPDILGNLTAGTPDAGAGEKFSIKTLTPVLKALQEVKRLQNLLCLDGHYEVDLRLRSRENAPERELFFVECRAALDALNDGQLDKMKEFFGGNAPDRGGDVSLKAVEIAYDFSVLFDKDAGGLFLESDDDFVITCGSAEILTGESPFDDWRIKLLRLSAWTRLNLNAGTPDAVFSHSLTLDVDRAVAENLLYGNIEIDQIGASAVFENEWRVFADVSAYGSAARISADWGKDGILAFDFSVFPHFEKLREIPAVDAFVPAELETLAFSSRPRVAGTLRLDASGAFERVDFNFDAPPAVWETLRTDFVRGNVRITPDALTVWDARVGGNGFFTNASLRVCLDGSGFFRTQIGGSFYNVETLDPFLDWFWWRIWRDVKLNPDAPAPRLNLEIYGSFADEKFWERIFGFVAVEGASRNGCPTDKVSLKICEEEDFVAVPEIDVAKGEGRVAGTLLFNYSADPEPVMTLFQFDFRGEKMPAGDVLALTGEGVPEALAGLQLETDAFVKARAVGNFSGDDAAGPEISRVDVDIERIDGVYKILDVEAADFSGKIVYDRTRVEVNDIQSDFGGGKVSGTLVLDFPDKEMNFAGTRAEIQNLKIENVKLSRLNAVVEKFLSFSPAAKKEEALEIFVKKESPSGIENSTVNAEFSGNFTLPEISTLSGNGRFSLSDETLFEYEVFGRVSKMLSLVSISVFSFDITNAEGSLAVVDGVAFSPDLKLYSENALVEGGAQCRLQTLEIAGDFVFKNRRGTGIPVVGTILEGVSMFTVLTPFSISGTLYEPDISLSPLSSEKSIFNFNKSGKNGREGKNR